MNKLVVFTRKGCYYKYEPVLKLLACTDPYIIFPTNVFYNLPRRFSVPDIVIPVPVEPLLCILEDEAVLSCCYSGSA